MATDDNIKSNSRVEELYLTIEKLSNKEHISKHIKMSDDDDSDVEDLGHTTNKKENSGRPKKRKISAKIKEKKRARFTSEQTHSEIAEIYHEKGIKEGTQTKYRSKIKYSYSEEFSPDAVDDKSEFIVPHWQVVGMQSTGIPPHLPISKQMKDLSERLELLEESIHRHHSNLTSTLPEAIATKTAEEIRQNFEVNGVPPLSTRDVQAFMENWQAALESMKSTIVKDISDWIRTGTTTTVALDAKCQHFDSFDWNDELIDHAVPKDWEWPQRLPMKGLMDMWWHGSDVVASPRPGEEPRRMHIRPYCTINRTFDIRPKDKLNYSRARIVALHMEEIIKSNGLLPAGVARCVDLTIVQGDEVFRAAYDLLLQQLRSVVKMKREAELCYGTVYTSLNKIKRTEGPSRRENVVKEE